MVKDFFKWYEQRISETAVDPIYIWKHGMKEADKYRRNGGTIDMGDNETKYIFKMSHSRYYKNHRKEFASLPVTARMADNRLSLGSELISQKKYEDFEFLTAQHHLVQHHHEYYVISPNLLQGYVDYQTAYQISQDGYGDMPLHSKVLRKSSRLSLKQVLKKKKQFLSIMTEECFDQYIKYLLASVFEFSDDEHSNNIIFVRNHKSDKFEALFVFDKESTVFNPLIAKGNKWGEVKYQSVIYDHYVGKFIAFPGESIIERTREIGELIAKGKLEKKYVDFLNAIASYDYCETARRVYHETGKRVNQMQIDMYRVGSEYAAQALEMQ